MCLFHPECQAWELETGGFCRLLQSTPGSGLTLSANDYTLVGILNSDARASSRGRSGASGLHEVRKAAKGPGAPAAPEAPAAGASQGLGGMGADAVNTRATPTAGGVELGSAGVISPQAVSCYSPGGALIKCIEDDEPCGDDGSGRGLFSNSSESLSSALRRKQVLAAYMMCCQCQHTNTCVDSTRACHCGRYRDRLTLWFWSRATRVPRLQETELINRPLTTATLCTSCVTRTSVHTLQLCKGPRGWGDACSWLLLSRSLSWMYSEITLRLV